jgi:hypothetical protein
VLGWCSLGGWLLGRFDWCAGGGHRAGAVDALGAVGGGAAAAPPPPPTATAVDALGGGPNRTSTTSCLKCLDAIYSVNRYEESTLERNGIGSHACLLEASRCGGIFECKSLPKNAHRTRCIPSLLPPTYVWPSWISWRTSGQEDHHPSPSCR